MWARCQRYRETGDFYDPVDEFPAILWDGPRNWKGPHGYVCYETEQELLNDPILTRHPSWKKRRAVCLIAAVGAADDVRECAQPAS